MPQFNQSKAAGVDTSQSSNPLVNGTILSQSGAVIAISNKRIAKTDFGVSVFCDFEYADDAYDANGNRPQYTAVFSDRSAVFKQLQAIPEIDPADPLECIVLPEGKSFRLADLSEAAPAAPAVTASAPVAPNPTANARNALATEARMRRQEEAKASRPSTF